jgi:hypothetical protein
MLDEELGSLIGPSSSFELSEVVDCQPDALENRPESFRRPVVPTGDAVSCAVPLSDSFDAPSAHEAWLRESAGRCCLRPHGT